MSNNSIKPMRKREEILNIEGEQRPVTNAEWDKAEILEVLLDIRDLLIESKTDKQV